MIKMKSQQKSHSGLAPNVKEKIHHIHQPSSKPINPPWFSWSCGNKETAAFRSGGEGKSIASQGGPGSFPSCLLNGMPVVGNTPVIPCLHSGHYAPLSQT